MNKFRKYFKIIFLIKGFVFFNSFAMGVEPNFETQEIGYNEVFTSYPQYDPITRRIPEVIGMTQIYVGDFLGPCEVVFLEPKEVEAPPEGTFVLPPLIVTASRCPLTPYYIYEPIVRDVEVTEYEYKGEALVIVKIPVLGLVRKGWMKNGERIDFGNPLPDRFKKVLNKSFKTPVGKTVGQIQKEWSLGLGRPYKEDTTNPVTGQREKHGANDYAAEGGTDIKSPSDGIVILSYESPTYGEISVIDYGELIGDSEGNHLYGLFAHMKKGSREYEVGEIVNKGDVLGKVGSTGISTHNHLHEGLFIMKNFVLTGHQQYSIDPWDINIERSTK